MAYSEANGKKQALFPTIVGKTYQIEEIFETIRKVANSDIPVLIYGETGTGKELIAYAIHYQSRRAKGPFVKIDCSVLPPTLLESELFGHVRGAFTGAVKDRIGRFELADGGTLFIDEVGDISPLIQLKLLRFVQEREFERVGESRPRKLDVRMIFATNRDLRQLMKEGKFREDLYYRLNVLTVYAPPLRKRKEDIPLLVDYFVKNGNQKYTKVIRGCTDEVLQILCEYDWPGNVRELEHAIEHASVLCQGDFLGLEDLPKEIIEGGFFFLKESVEREDGDQEKTTLLEALEKTGWNKTKAAQILKVSRVTLWKKIKKYGLEKGSLPSDSLRSGEREKKLKKPMYHI
ncbi:MAG: sigma-54-dependent Fis family transcriptional regulator [Candidatus Tectomicrobia bacterium]|nr:sigma-54-dependent Fis family transcriptional regulator [Candidatus Tectomicrobia bacterium]